MLHITCGTLHVSSPKMLHLFILGSVYCVMHAWHHRLLALRVPTQLTEVHSCRARWRTSLRAQPRPGRRWEGARWCLLAASYSAEMVLLPTSWWALHHFPHRTANRYERPLWHSPKVLVATSEVIKPWWCFHPNSSKFDLPRMMGHSVAFVVVASEVKACSMAGGAQWLPDVPHRNWQQCRHCILVLIVTWCTDSAPQVAKAFGDMEAIYTYEGTYEVNVLVAGRGITGKAAFKAAPARQQPKSVQA